MNRTIRIVLTAIFDCDGRNSPYYDHTVSRPKQSKIAVVGCLVVAVLGTGSRRERIRETSAATSDPFVSPVISDFSGRLRSMSGNIRSEATAWATAARIDEIFVNLSRAIQE